MRIEPAAGDSLNRVHLSTSNSDSFPKRRTVSRAFFISLFCIICFLCSLRKRWGLHYSSKQHQSSAVIFAATCRKTKSGVDVVVSGCRSQNVQGTLALLGPLALSIDNVHIYLKCGSVKLHEAYFTSPESQCLGTTVVSTSLVNAGREGHTFLYHILRHWETLAEYTVFLQDSPEEHFFPGLTVADYLSPRIFFPLSAQLMFVGEMTLHRMRDGFEGIHRCHSPRLVDKAYWTAQNQASKMTLSQPGGRWGNSTAYFPHLGEIVPGIIMHKARSYNCNKEVAFGGIGPWECNWVPMMFPWLRFSDASNSTVSDIAKGWSYIFETPLPDLLYYAVGSQFTLPRDIIHSVPASRYERALSYLSGEEKPFIYHVELFFWYIFNLDKFHDATNLQQLRPFACTKLEEGDSDCGADYRLTTS